jgi:DNA-binding response OmpR family regulator
MSKLGTKTVLLLEDTALAAWEIEDELREAGYDVAGSFSSCAKAEQWLQNNSPDAAILDLRLGDGTCVAVARILNARGIPFLLQSAVDPKLGELDDPALRGAPLVGKPIDTATMLNILKGLVRPMKAAE